INIKLQGFFLRRPISVCDYEGNELTIIYKIMGRGTEYLASLPAGTELDVLTGLGNGFDINVPSEKPVLIGGGVGTPPMYKLCKELIKAGKKPSVVLGFNRAEDAFYKEEFEALGVGVTIATVDGSLGIKGFVTDALSDIDYDYFFTCGPEPMLKAVYRATGEIKGQLSFEERMGCGFGACMGCSCETLTGYKRICKDGPVLMKEEIKW
ncbi:MAG: dihydroorotate dehydrogenase electron transfer subunit, partial [Oscillospiraceae bacterium]|nr:dihydroorotate dehydrogenase electron transfer subunit [Oscillospiraceae bacterium]